MMRNIETFPSKQMYTYLSLVERKDAEFFHNIVPYFSWEPFPYMTRISGSMYNDMTYGICNNASSVNDFPIFDLNIC